MEVQCVCRSTHMCMGARTGAVVLYQYVAFRTYRGAVAVARQTLVRWHYLLGGVPIKPSMHPGGGVRMHTSVLLWLHVILASMCHCQ
jgi:hypothetical protein